jgi:hypothetical protein
MIPGHLPQAWHKPRGVPIPYDQVSLFGDEGVGGGVEAAILSSNFHGRGSPSLEDEKVPGVLQLAAKLMPLNLASYSRFWV